MFSFLNPGFTHNLPVFTAEIVTGLIITAAILVALTIAGVLYWRANGRDAYLLVPVAVLWVVAAICVPPVVHAQAAAGNDLLHATTVAGWVGDTYGLDITRYQAQDALNGHAVFVDHPDAPLDIRFTETVGGDIRVISNGADAWAPLEAR